MARTAKKSPSKKGRTKPQVSKEHQQFLALRTKLRKQYKALQDEYEELGEQVSDLEDEVEGLQEEMGDLEERMDKISDLLEEDND